jgi:tetratricopeptide (TPR) repeat protein
VLVFALACGLAAAAPNRAVEEATRREAVGQWERARQLIESQLEQVAPAEADELRLRICATFHTQARLAEARDCYVARRSRMATTEAAAMARYRAAILDVELGQSRVARREADWLLIHGPESAAARRAVQLLRALRREEGGAAGEADFLLGVASQLRSRAGRSLRPEPKPDPVRDLYVECLVDAARIRLVERGLGSSAARLLDRAVRAAVMTNWIDDALIWQARARRANGAHAAALESYQRLLALHETSWFVGSYESQFRDDAMLEIGETLEEMGRTGDALAAYERLVEDAPASRLRDDAAFRGAKLSGDAASLRAFLGDYPESRHAAEARRLLEKP